LSGKAGGIKAAREYSALLDLADRRNIQSLWQRLEQLSDSDDDLSRSALSAFAFDSETDSRFRGWLLDRCVEVVRSMGYDARPILFAEMQRPSRMQGWALVFLAKLKAPQVLDKVRAELAAAKQAEGDDGFSLICDYYYALELLGTREARELINARDKPAFLDEPATRVMSWFATRSETPDD
jgi:hypothetical protein